MRDEARKVEVFNKIILSLKLFDKNLKNKNIMFVAETNNKSLEMEEVFFPKSCFYHLTGVNVFNREGKKLNSYEFYRLFKNSRVNLKEFYFEEKDMTTDLKLDVLPQLMDIDKNANMIGDFAGSNIFLQTQKVSGNIRACLGLTKAKENIFYIPNTALKEDIRNITNNRLTVVAILKKDIYDKLYRNITYLKKTYDIDSILKKKDISMYIDKMNLFSNDKKISDKICTYYSSIL